MMNPVRAGAASGEEWTGSTITCPIEQRYPASMLDNASAPSTHCYCTEETKRFAEPADWQIGGLLNCLDGWSIFDARENVERRPCFEGGLGGERELGARSLREHDEQGEPTRRTSDATRIISGTEKTQDRCLMSFQRRESTGRSPPGKFVHKYLTCGGCGFQLVQRVQTQGSRTGEAGNQGESKSPQ